MPVRNTLIAKPFPKLFDLRRISGGEHTHCYYVSVCGSSYDLYTVALNWLLRLCCTCSESQPNSQRRMQMILAWAQNLMDSASRHPRWLALYRTQLTTTMLATGSGKGGNGGLRSSPPPQALQCDIWQCDLLLIPHLSWHAAGEVYLNLHSCIHSFTWKVFTEKFIVYQAW